MAEVAAVIKSPFLQTGGLDLVPHCSVDVRPSAENVAYLTSSSAVAAAVASAPIAKQEVAQTKRKEIPAVVATEVNGEGIDTRDRQYQEALNQRLKAQESLLAEAREKASAAAYAEGLESGRRDGARDLAEAVGTFRTLLEKGKEQISSVIQESEEVIGAIVFEAVCKIVGRRLLSREVCMEVVKEVISRASSEETISVRVSSADYAQICSALAEGGNGLASLSAVSFVPDDAVELGGCLLTLKGGSIDGRIETQFRSLAQSLKDAARRG